MKAKIWHTEFVRRQNGWTCAITFTFLTAEQFTDHEMTVYSACYRWWLAAWWNARLSMKLHLEVHGAKKGERLAKGWAE